MPPVIVPASVCLGAPGVVGLVVSGELSVMSSLTGDAETLPAASMNLTYTVFGPLPPVRIHGIEAAYAVGVTPVKSVLFEIRTCVVPLPAPSSVVSVRVTAAVAVSASSSLMTTVPVGAVWSIVMDALTGADQLPALSRHWA